MKQKQMVLAALRKKEAELDSLDDQILGLPGGIKSNKFDSLATQREQLEKTIRQLQEKMEFLNKWEALRNEDWSQELKSQLQGVDNGVLSVVSPGEGAASTASEPIPMEPAAAPEPPISSAPPPTSEEPWSTEPMDTDEPISQGSTELAEPKENNFPNSEEKDTTDLKGNTMEKASSLKEKIADIKARKQQISKEARTRVASAWTIAKTMLPGAPAEVQQKFAQVLLGASTKMLKSALRQTAVNAHYTKIAETFKEVHKVEMNDLLEDPSVLNKEKNSVKSELKTDPKNAAKKVADDRKDAGPLPSEYPEPTRKEPAAVDAGKAADRPNDTVNKSEGDKKAAKKACNCGATGCVKCKQAADEGDKKEAEPPAAPFKEENKSDEPPAESPAEEESPEETPEADSPAAVLSDEQKLEIHEKIEEAEQAIEALEKEILDESSEELDLDSIFNEDAMEEKVSSLANEDDEIGEEEPNFEDEDFFAPSDPGEMEAGLEEDGMGDTSDIFTSTGDYDPLGEMLKGAALSEGVVEPGELASHFENKEVSADSRDSQTDHEDDILLSAVKSIKPESQGATRVMQDSTSKLDTPPAAKKKATLQKIKAAAPPASKEAVDIETALFGDF